MNGDFELRHLRYFVAVAEEQNVTRAAARLFVTQPALSRQMKDLEKALGVELFQRTSSGFNLTPAGLDFLPRARQVLEAASEAGLAMRAFAECRKRSLAIGYLAPSLGSFLGTALQVFNQRHAQVEVSLFELPPTRQLEALKEGRLDIALIGHACAELQKDFALETIYGVPLQAVLPASHALTARKELALRDLKKEKFISLSAATFPGRNEVIRALCRTAGFAPHFAHEADGLLSVLALIGSGLGVSLMPDEVAQLPHPNVTFKPLMPKTEIQFTAALRLGENRPTVRAILEEFRAAARH